MKTWNAFIKKGTKQIPFTHTVDGEYKRVCKIITEPGMAINMEKTLSYIRQHPVNQQLNTFGSAFPEFHDKYDLKMMSKLERLRVLAELKNENKKLMEKAKEGSLKLQRMDKELAEKEMEQKLTEKLSKQKPTGDGK